MEHWKWSKNWVCEGLSNGAQDASAGDGTALAKGIDSSSLVEGTVMPLAHLANGAARANADLPAPAKLGTLDYAIAVFVTFGHVLQRSDTSFAIAAFPMFHESICSSHDLARVM